jgi:hypothetical protein
MNVSDDKENIKAMMKGSKDFIGCDLITDPLCVAGGKHTSSLENLPKRRN